MTLTLSSGLGARGTNKGNIGPSPSHARLALGSDLSSHPGWNASISLGRIVAGNTNEGRANSPPPQKHPLLNDVTKHRKSNRSRPPLPSQSEYMSPTMNLSWKQRKSKKSRLVL